MNLITPNSRYTVCIGCNQRRRKENLIAIGSCQICFECCGYYAEAYKSCRECYQKEDLIVVEDRQVCLTCYEEYEICNGCKHKRKNVNKIHQICRSCNEEYGVCYECNQLKIEKNLTIIEHRQVCHSCCYKKYKVCCECSQRKRKENITIIEDRQV